MNKTIRKCAVCSVLTAAVVTGWGNPVIGSPRKTPPSTAVAQKPTVSAQPAPKVSAPAVAAPKEASKPPATPVAKPPATPVARPPAVPVAKPAAASSVKSVAPVAPATPKAVASAAPAPTATQKALKVLGADVAVDEGLKYAAEGKRLVSCDPKAVAVKVKKGVELIYGNAFRGCAELLRVQFLGDAPSAAEEVFADLPRGCTIYVEKGGKGWPTVPGIWKGLGVRSVDEIKEMPMTSAGLVTLDATVFKVRPCGDGIALSADEKGSLASTATTLAIPEKIGSAPVRILGDSVFPACTKLAKVVIPASVTNFGLSAFSRCGRPQQIEIAAGNPAYRMDGGLVYEVESKSVILAGANVSAAKVPADAEKIGPEAFKGCELLTSIELPPTLKSIGKGAFAGCMGLSVVTVPADADVAADAFEGCCATVRKLGTYSHYEGFAGKKAAVKWIPEDRKLLTEVALSDPLPLREAIEIAGKGDGFALYSLAVHCAKGGEVKKDPARAMEYLHKAVSAKDANAEFLLGLILESRMKGSDLDDPKAAGIAGRFGVSFSAAAAATAFERYVGVPSSAFADAKKTESAGSLANEDDYELVCGVYDAVRQHGCAAAAMRLEHVSYLSMLECGRIEKEDNQRLLDGLQRR